jgi:hypothetical protein
MANVFTRWINRTVNSSEMLALQQERAFLSNAMGDAIATQTAYSEDFYRSPSARSMEKITEQMAEMIRIRERINAIDQKLARF